MPMQSVKLRPGVDVEQTPSLNEAGVYQSQMIRYREGLIETMGGWTNILGTSPSTVRDIHAWQDIRNTKWLATGGLSNLIVMTSTGQADITPQTRTSSFAPNFSVSSGGVNVTIDDANSGLSIYDSVFFNTQITVGGLLLQGAYPVTAVFSTGSYQITSSSSTGSSVAVTSSGILPLFTTISGSPTITVTLPSNNYQSVVGLQESFYAATSVGGLTVQGPYDVTAIIDSTSFNITATQQASASATSTMNAGVAQLVYYTTLGPQGTTGGFGSGGFGAGGFGLGTATTGTGGTPITVIDWTLDNWGEILLACPENGPIFAWSADSGFQQAQVVATAPFFNGGIFISQPQQILVAWRSTEDNTGTQNNLVVRWSNSADYTNWQVTTQTAAGAFTIPTGSILMGGIQAPNYGVVWTDVDVWIMQYVGGVVIFNFTRVGAGCGLIGKHACNIIGGIVYWASNSNFFTLGANGATVLPCSVWDFFFQGINTTYQSKVWCAPNSSFNEITWFFPYGTATENNAYVKYNVVEGEWDYGMLTRTSWIDVSVFGQPIGTDNNGTVYQHESGQNFPGAALPSFRTGWFNIVDGNDLVFVDWCLPDFIWSRYGGSANAQVNLTFYAVDYPGDTPRQYGPFTVTQSTEYIAPRLRGRLVSVLIQSNNQIFWRLGRIRFRFATSGRR